MQVFIDIFTAASKSPHSLPILLSSIICALSIFFYKEIKSLHKENLENHNSIYAQYKDDNDKIIKQMFETVNKNTESHIKLSEAVRDLSYKIK